MNSESFLKNLHLFQTMLNMLNRYPKSTISGVLLFGAVNYYAYSMKSYPYYGYHDGIRDGYQMAQDALRKQAKSEIQNAIKYSKENIILSKKGTLPIEYLEDTMDMFVRPRREVDLLGIKFIITSWKDKFGWFTPKEEHELLRNNFKKIILDLPDGETVLDRLEEIERKLDEDLHKSAKNKVKSCVENK